MRCWVTDDFKLVLNLFTSDELYEDRRNDPNEMHNLIDDIRFADVRSKMHDALLDYMDKIRDPFRSYQWSLRPWRKDAHCRAGWGHFVHAHKMAIRRWYVTMTPAYRRKE